MQREREKFTKSIENIDTSKLVTLDESSVNLSYSRNYGRALTSERLKEGRKDVRFQRESILSTMRLNGETCPLVFSGTLDKELFATYIRTQLKPTLAADDVLLLDNSSVHRSKLVVDTLDACGIKVLWLPRYSPDYNPIELFWAYLKSFLRKFKARTRDKLDAAIVHVFESLPTDFIKHWFQHCGFTVNV